MRRVGAIVGLVVAVALGYGVVAWWAKDEPSSQDEAARRATLGKRPAAWKLGPAGDEVRRIIAEADDPVLSAQTMAQLGDDRANEGSETLGQVALRSTDRLQRRLALQHLGTRRDEPAVEVLRELASSEEDPYVRAEAALALGETGVPAAELVARYGKEEDPMVLRTLARSLAREGSAEAAQFLLERARSGDREVLRALGTIENSAALGVLAQALAGDAELIAACASALGRMGDPRAVALLVPLLDSAQPPAVRVAVAQALGLLGFSTALEPLRRIAVDSSDPAQLAAKQAIARIEFVTAQALAAGRPNQ